MNGCNAVSVVGLAVLMCVIAAALIGYFAMRAPA